MLLTPAPAAIPAATLARHVLFCLPPRTFLAGPSACCFWCACQFVANQLASVRPVWRLQSLQASVPRAHSEITPPCRILSWRKEPLPSPPSGASETTAVPSTAPKNRGQSRKQKQKQNTLATHPRPHHTANAAASQYAMAGPNPGRGVQVKTTMRAKRTQIAHTVRPRDHGHAPDRGRRLHAQTPRRGQGRGRGLGLGHGHGHGRA